jgi:small conductance mechanosensitive channel
METAAQDAITTINAGVGTIWALAITYSFSVLGAILLVVFGYVIARFVERGIKAALGQFHGFDATLRQFFASTARYAILVLVVVMVLGQFGVQTASIIAALGAIGLAIGLALQGTLQNIAAGVMLLVLRPFRVGEFIEVGQVTGTVEDVGLFATCLTTADGVYLLSPNSKLWNEPVINYSRNVRRRTDITIGIGYGDDIDLARSTLMGLAEADARVMKDPAPATYVTALGDSSVSVTLRYWTATSEFFATQTDLTRAAKLAFDERGISIPFPQQEVTYRTSNGAAPVMNS